MPITIVVGGQYGSEGKGKVVNYLTRSEGIQMAVKVGGSNSGHISYDQEGNRVVFHHISAACLEPGVKCILPPGNYIDPDVFLKDLSYGYVDAEDVFVDPYAAVITKEDRNYEQDHNLGQEFGCTLSGTTSSVVRRVKRDGSLKLAKDEPKLKPFIKPTLQIMSDYLDLGERIIIEGTQGYGLSLLHSTHYPYATGRDSTAASFLSEAGLSPLDVDEIVLVLRSFPIRVGGNSGPLPNEISWEDITERMGSSSPIKEYTTVTKKLRRVALFDPYLVRRAIQTNNPTTIVLNHLDYVDGNSDYSKLSNSQISFIRHIELDIGQQIDYVGLDGKSLLRLDGHSQ